MNIATDPAPAGLVSSLAGAPPTQGNEGTAGPGAELAALFQSLLDDHAAGAVAAAATAHGGARPGGTSLPSADAALPARRDGDNANESADVFAALAALLGLAAPTRPVDSLPAPAPKDTAVGPREASMELPEPGGAAPVAALLPFDPAALVDAAALDNGVVTPNPEPDAAAAPAGRVPGSAAPAVALAPAGTAAGRALARALGALATVTEPQAAAASPVTTLPKGPVPTGLVPTGPVLSTSVTGQTAIALPTPSAQPAAVGGVVAVVNDAAAIDNAAAASNAADTYTFAAAGSAADRQSLEAATVVPRSGSPEASNRLNQAAASQPRAADVDVNARLSASFTAGMTIRTEGPHVEAVLSGQQASIELAAPIAAPETGEAGTVADQIVRAIRIQVRDGIGEARLRLQPDHMGEVYIELKVDRDRVTAVLQVERPEVRAQIEGQGQTLRAGLAAQGLHLEELTVRDESQGRKDDGGSDRSGDHARQQQERRRRRSNGQLFELDEP